MCHQKKIKKLQQLFSQKIIPLVQDQPILLDKAIQLAELFITSHKMHSTLSHNKSNEMTEEEYDKQCYCTNCGERENLAFDNNYGGWHRYICRECGDPFQIRQVTTN